MPGRTYADRCPGVLRPWLAEDGAIVRLRVPGGHVSGATLEHLVAIAERYGDGSVLLTKRANLQLRGIAAIDGEAPAELVDELETIGLLPSRTHELVRNILVSPLTGLTGGRADLRALVAQLDRALLEDPELAGLGGRFLFVLDDGRGDVAGRDLDLGVVAVDESRVQVRAGTAHWGSVIPVDEAPDVLARAARRFQERRGSGDSAWWHVDELPDGGASLIDGDVRDPATEVASAPATLGRHRADDGRAFEVRDVPDGVVRRALAVELAHAELVVTPWRSVVVIEEEAA